MKKISILDTFILFASLAFLTMFVDQVLYKGNGFWENYFFLMFGFGGILFFLQRRANRILKEKQGKK